MILEDILKVERRICCPRHLLIRKTFTILHSNINYQFFSTLRNFLFILSQGNSDNDADRFQPQLWLNIDTNTQLFGI